MERYLYLTVASPASKKTTTCRRMIQDMDNVVLITVDDFRLSFYESRFSETKEDYLKQIILNTILSFSKTPDTNIVLDESKWLIDKGNRKYWIALGKWLGFRVIGLYFNRTLDFCLENNSKRKENKVPEVVLKNLYSQLEKPELEEGFYDIIEANNL